MQLGIADYHLLLTYTCVSNLSLFIYTALCLKEFVYKPRNFVTVQGNFYLPHLLYPSKISNLYDLFKRIQKANPSSAEGEGAKAQWRSFLRSNQSIIVQVMISVIFFKQRFYSTFENRTVMLWRPSSKKNIFSSDTYSFSQRICKLTSLHSFSVDRQSRQSAAPPVTPSGSNIKYAILKNNGWG